ncbi:YbaN family protein [Pseudomonas indica]|uniref:YbaN family protein n=1 Tax=Pseudomonas indica TaxID=137658 RepID=UPI0023F96708|nr:YbaN family protein [Pseudomonas indica]MBU3054755.1 YbaN family protein [Pseudomonas indica]
MNRPTPQPDIREARHPAVRYVLLAVGWLCIVLGVIGIFLPVLPTTPFLLLAAACFVRSSRRFYLWLVTHPRLGPWIRDYLDGQGIPLKGKVYAIVLMWVSIGFSCYLVPMIWARVFMLSSAVLVTLYILKQKTLPAR